MLAPGLLPGIEPGAFGPGAGTDIFVLDGQGVATIERLEGSPPGPGTDVC